MDRGGFVSEKEMWLPIGPAASRLAVSISKLRNMALKGQIASIRLPGTNKKNGELRFHVHEINRMRVLIGLDKPPAAAGDGVEISEEPPKTAEDQISIDDYLS
jgi:hypothetical protein